MSDDETLFQLSPDLDECRRQAQIAFEKWCRQHARALPAEALIEHVGATAVPGCETKGDLDVAVRVASADFPAALAYLDSSHQSNVRSARREGFAAFIATGYALEVGVQLVVRGDKLDQFSAFRDALIADKVLVARYNALKRAYRGRSMAQYRDAKAEFIKTVLGV
ncbi:GrpB family protein [Oceanicaulis sp. UBA2681]|uniref:GrpB family protein n=1 Tax=Oceanicaulis sp. UBA2681 TaxID=1947007 RepID=UPI00257BDDFF|nr:GrpB family protein [Oceanicaulis sp. UBA2681]